MKIIYISVINDISHDQRVHKVCSSLEAQGYEVHLVGRELPDSTPLERSYGTHRMKLPFHQGALFYAAYNIHLFFYLLFKKVDILHANDLDTLLANYLVSRIRNKPLVYDSHEYFTGVPEIQNNKFVKWTWTTLERWIFPSLQYVFTVNDSIAALYETAYGKRPVVLRNIPTTSSLPDPYTKKEIGISETTKLLVLQGAGINVDRGAEELLEAVVHLDNYLLLIIGSGDVIEALKQRAAKEDLKNKVRFLGKLPYLEMMRYTQAADAGLTLDKDTNINYRFSLPNKVFDYIRAEIPVISSKIIEIERVIEKYDIGTIIPTFVPLTMAETIDKFLTTSQPDALKKNLKEASRQLSWETEVVSMLEVYKHLTKI